MSDNDNRRKLVRTPVNQRVIITDVIKGRELGSIANLHDEGFLVIGTGEMKSNCLYQLSFTLSLPIRGVETISVGAECLWVTEGGGEGQYWAGFHIIDLAEEDAPLITELMEHISEDD